MDPVNNQAGGNGAAPQQNGAAQELVGLPSRLRIVTVFAMWWEELSSVLFSNTVQATRCLLHIARILEDATAVGDRKPDSPDAMLDEDDEELEMLSVRLVKIVINEFGDVAESMFRHMTSATDVPFIRAGMRFLIAYKQACWRTYDDFYIIYQADLLEAFLSENATTTDALFGARLAFLAGELIEETDAQSPIAPTEILDTVISRFRNAKEAIQNRVDEVVAFVNNQSVRTAYINDGSITIPVPGDALSYSAEWDTDEATNTNSIDYELSIVIGNLRLLGAIADYTEVLHPCIEAGIVQSCLELLDLPHFALQVYALGWFSAAIIHKRIAVDFVESGGITAVKDFTYKNRQDQKKFTLLAPYVSYILVALSKHSQAMEAILNGNGGQQQSNNGSTSNDVSNYVSSESIANDFFTFGLELLTDDSVDTQLNIVEWIGECFSYPLLLKLAYQRNILELLGQKLKLSLVIEQSEEKSMSLKSSLRKETVRSILKFISVNLFWAVQYSKSMSAETLLDTKNHHGHSNGSISSSSSGKFQGFSPSKKYFSFNLNSSKTDGLSSSSAGAGESSKSSSWVNSSTMVKVNDDDLLALEAFVQQSLIKGGTLPIGLTINLFDSSSEQLIQSSKSFSNGEFRDDETITSLASQACLRNKILPEWSVAKLFIQSHLIPILLKAFIVETKDSAIISMLLLILELLCLDAAIIVELQYQQPIDLPSAVAADSEANQLQGRKGLEILLSSIGTPSRKDPSVISSTLRLLSAMCTPPQFRYKGNNIQAAKTLLDDFVAITASSQVSGATGVAASAMKKRFDTSVKKVYVFQRDLHSQLEQVQKSIRTAIRSYSGINSLMQLIYYKKNQLYAVNVRLETVKVLLGMAQDNEIKLILSKMRIPTILENQVRAETSQMNYLEMNAGAASSKSTEKNVLDFYCEILTSLLNNSTGDTTITERNLDATQDALERKAIVDHSHIDYHEAELMQLIKEHLLAKGLTKTVAALEQELAEGENAANGEFNQPQSNGLKTPFQDTRKRQRDIAPQLSVPAPTLQRSPSENEEVAAATSSSTRKLKRILANEIQQDEGAGEFPAPHLPSSTRSRTSTPLPETSSVVPTSKIHQRPSTVAVSKAQRKRNLCRALKQPNHASVTLASSSSVVVGPSSPRGPGGAEKGGLFSPPPTNSAVIPNKKVQMNAPSKQSNHHQHAHSKLHNIMHRYLKIQHSQCKHPITTLPVLSLQKPHFCSKPTVSPFGNIMNVVNRHVSMRDSWQYSHQKHEIYGQRLQYIYSAYRPIRTMRQVDNSSISAAAFCSDPSKMWLSYYDDWQNDGPGIALVDVSTGLELSLSGLEEIDGILSKFTLSPKTATTPNSFILTSVTNFYQYQNFYLEHDLYLWKDTSSHGQEDMEVFNQRPAQHFRVFANHENQTVQPGTTGDEDDRETLLFTTEAFNPSGRQIAALHAGGDSASGAGIDTLNNTCTAYILDIETGLVIQKVHNTGSENTYLVPTLNYVSHDENLLVMDGKLWDIRQATSSLPIHRFDKLSFAGNTAIHPYKYDIIIDNAIWDLRNCSNLKQTVPLLDNCKVKFDGTGNVLFGYRSLDEERDELKMNMNHSVPDNNFFHVLNAQDYSHLHTEVIERENMLLWDLDVDRQGAGYLSTLMFTNHFSESMCRVFEIGKRKKTLGDGDSDGEEDEDNDGDWDSQADGADDDMDTIENDDDDSDSNDTGESDADDDIDDSTMDDSDEEGDEEDDEDDDDLDVDFADYDEDDEDDENDEDYEPTARRGGDEDEDGWETMSEDDS